MGAAGAEPAWHDAEMAAHPDGTMRALAALLGGATGMPSVLAREIWLEDTRFDVEVVTCRLPDGDTTRLFCKHGPSTQAGLVHEAIVYQQVLGPLGVTAPRCFGFHHDRATECDWLVLEFLHGATPLTHIRNPRALDRATRWLGDFHAVAQGAEGCRPPFPRRDAAWYRTGMERAADRAEPLLRHHPWLWELCRRGGELCGPLLEAPVSLLHGRYVPGSILVRAGTIHPVDWEGAAVGPGELDLAVFTWGWPVRPRQRLERVHAKARWPGGPPAGFARTLQAARLHTCFRMLGDPCEPLPGRQYRRLLRTLRQLMHDRDGAAPVA